MKRALISVSDKTGIVELAKKLVGHDIEVVSTGGTHRLLMEAGVPVTNISDITGFPEIMDGRVKTLHPNIHGGLLAIRSNPAHMEAIEGLNIQPIDYVIVNLYPFKETIAKPSVTFEDAIENIDIGGPSMLRAAAKNYQDVAVVVDANDYPRLIDALDNNNPLTKEEKLALATKVFRHTAAYDALIAQYLTSSVGEEFPEKLTLTYEKVQDMRYGENPHQKSAFYKQVDAGSHTIAGGKQLHGKELSFNNINDANAALALLQEFSEPCAVAIKHTNPSGVGVADNIHDAFVKAYESDPVSIFGGIVAMNREVDAATAQKMSEIFLEIILAPSYSDEALEILTKKKNVRIMTIEITPQAGIQGLSQHTTLKVQGGLLVQDQDLHEINVDELKVVTKRQPTEEELKQLLFAWKVAKHVKSNAIVLAKSDRTVGVGAGQMNRVGSCKIAIDQAGELVTGSVMASDAFFPMNDTVLTAAGAGITAIIQPGGSIKDADSIAAADDNGIAMVFTGVRHFKH
jgi:phosphoribosylaminoimidazolecarboxamide formyltransferase / IMP cyclohydrolase